MRHHHHNILDGSTVVLHHDHPGGNNHNHDFGYNYDTASCRDDDCPHRIHDDQLRYTDDSPPLGNTNNNLGWDSPTGRNPTPRLEHDDGPNSDLVDVDHPRWDT